MTKFEWQLHIPLRVRDLPVNTYQISVFHCQNILVALNVSQKHLVLEGWQGVIVHG